MSPSVPATHTTCDALGLIAGDGDLPRLIAEEAGRQAGRVVTVALSKTAARLLEPCSDTLVACGVGQAKKILATLHQHHIRRVVLAGKVRKQLLFENPRFDRRAVQMLRKAKRRDDKSILTLIIAELEQEGFEVLSQVDFLRPFLAPAGCFTRRKPTRREWCDISYGLQVARRMADLEVGQTVVVKDTTVLAIEAVEGTDEAIRRGCAHTGKHAGGKGAVVVKVSRSTQDFRFDVPAVGLQTVQGLIAAGGCVLAVEAERTLVVQREEMRKAANRAGVSIVAVP